MSIDEGNRANSYQGYQEDERFLDDYDSAETEPQIAAALATVWDLNQRLNMGVISEVECSSAIDALNDGLGAFIGLGYRASGMMHFMDTMANGSVLAPSTAYYDDIEVTFMGFTLAGQSMIVDGKETSYKSVAYRIERLVSGGEMVPDGRMTTYDGCADIDESFIDFSSENMSTDRAILWLAYHYPEVARDIDKRLRPENGGSDDETEAMLSLKDFTLDIATYAGGRDMEQDEIDRLCEAVELYIEHSVKIDHYVPYSASFEGAFRVFDKENEAPSRIRYASADTGGLFQITAVRLKPFGNMGEDPQGETPSLLSIYLDGMFLLSDRTQPGHRLIVPIESCVSLTSLRRDYYDRASK